MNTILCLVSLFVVASLLVSWVASRPRGRQFQALVNTAPSNWGTFAGGLRTFLADAAITTRYKLVKKGSDAEHIAIMAATSDEPIGVCVDEPSAAEQPATVEMLGVSARTVPVVAGGAITDGADLYGTSTGAVVVKPTAAGTYWQVGSAIGAWSTGESFTMVPRKPRKLIVIAALTSTNGTAAAASANLANLAAETEKIGDDLRAIAAALDGSADVALATT